MSKTKILKNLIEKAYEDRTVDGLHFEDVYDQGYVDGLEWALQKITDSEPTLNPNQQIVLAALKNNVEQYALRMNLIACISQLHTDSLEDGSTSVQEAYVSLSDKEEAQVLEVFAKWAQEQEGEI